METEKCETKDEKQETGSPRRSEMKGEDIAQKLVRMAALGIKLADALPHTMAGKHVASQLLRSVTASGADYEEARGAESRRDFVHKLARNRSRGQVTTGGWRGPGAPHREARSASMAMSSRLDDTARGHE